jgi:hypothetical protein
MKRYLPYLLIGVAALLIGDSAFAQNAIPSVPAPSGVTLTSNPLDDGVSLFKWGIKLILVLAALASLSGAAWFSWPKFVEASNNKGTYGMAVGNMFMLIVGAVVVCTLCAFAYNQIDGGGAINRAQAHQMPTHAIVIRDGVYA